MTFRTTPHPLGRTARAVLTATTLAGLGAGLALGSATAANAEIRTFNATSAQLEAACNKVGGTFTKHSDGSGWSCFTKSGFAQCNTQGYCEHYPHRPSRQADPIAPIIPAVDNARVA